jgi:hypothetical protein
MIKCTFRLLRKRASQAALAGRLGGQLKPKAITQRHTISVGRHVDHNLTTGTISNFEYKILEGGEMRWMGGGNDNTSEHAERTEKGHCQHALFDEKHTRSSSSQPKDIKCTSIYKFEFETREKLIAPRKLGQPSMQP